MESYKTSIHWFPGHMMRTLRRIEEKLSQVDAVVQLLDARIPYSSLNPDLQVAFGKKPRLYVLNKSDLADSGSTVAWLRHFYAEGSGGVAVNSKQRGAAGKVRPMVEEALAELLEKRKRQGMAGAKTRLMITGIPNVGKSSFINSWVGAARAKAADKPGVTRGEQWISADDYELLDMPGVLWKRFEDSRVAANLALVGCIPDTLLDMEAMAAGLLVQLAQPYAAQLTGRYKLDEATLQQDGWGLLEAVGRKRGMLVPGGDVDTERAAAVVLDEFRAGKLGRITLEVPEVPEVPHAKA